VASTSAASAALAEWLSSFPGCQQSQNQICKLPGSSTLLGRASLGKSLCTHMFCGLAPTSSTAEVCSCFQAI
jgi:hypothetical protein